MSVERVLRGALVVDGSGTEPRRADVTVVGDTIVEVGNESRRKGVEVVDLSGLVLAPGFIDIHTHYDAQVFWDARLTPSSSHGVTSVVLGNCGLTLAPVRAAHHDVLLETLQCVEGMSLDTLRAGVTWGFETFPEFLDVVRARQPGVNIGSFVGHTALRFYVLGDDAPDRPATPAEATRMRELLSEAVLAGALGFSTSMSGHIGPQGKPVASRAADDAELLEIVQGLSDVGKGVIQASGGTNKFPLLAELSTRSRRPLTWSALLTGLYGPAGAAVEMVERSAAAGGDLWPQVTNVPHVLQLQMDDPGPLRMSSAAFREAYLATDRPLTDAYRDPAWRARLPAELTLWNERLENATVQASSVHAALCDGPTLGELARDRGTTAAEVMLDLSLDDDLQTRFSVPAFNYDFDEVEQLLQDPRTILGLGDGGAHVNQICDSGYPSQLLGYWVRDREAITLEDAVWRLSGQPAAFLGLHRRGQIRQGWMADLVAFDPTTIDEGHPVRVWDFPAGGDRLVSKAEGLEHVWVNGVATILDGAELEDTHPGRVLTANAQYG